MMVPSYKLPLYSVVKPYLDDISVNVGICLFILIDRNLCLELNHYTILFLDCTNIHIPWISLN